VRVPEKITVHVKSEPPASLHGLIVELKVQAGRKNAYYIQFPKTDASGESELTRSDFVGQFTDHWEMALMDYDGTVEAASPLVEASLFDPTWSLQNRGHALAWPLLKHEQSKWASRELEYQHRTSSRNPRFSAQPVVVDLELTNNFTLQVTPRVLEEGAA
jgi:hypothetical protein